MLHWPFTPIISFKQHIPSDLLTTSLKEFPQEYKKRGENITQKNKDT